MLELLQYARVSCHSEEACVPKDRLLQQVAAGSKVLLCVECVTLSVGACVRAWHSVRVCVLLCLCTCVCVCVYVCAPIWSCMRVI